MIVLLTRSWVNGLRRGTIIGAAPTLMTPAGSSQAHCLRSVGGNSGGARQQAWVFGEGCVLEGWCEVDGVIGGGGIILLLLLSSTQL